MTSFDSPKAELAALRETLNAIEWPPQLKAGEPCPRCGRPLVRFEGRSDQPCFTCCPPCEAAADDLADALVAWQMAAQDEEEDE
jgi:hypothetical protein